MDAADDVDLLLLGELTQLTRWQTEVTSDSPGLVEELAYQAATAAVLARAARQLLDAGAAADAARAGERADQLAGQLPGWPEACPEYGYPTRPYALFTAQVRRLYAACPGCALHVPVWNGTARI